MEKKGWEGERHCPKATVQHNEAVGGEKGASNCGGGVKESGDMTVERQF